MDINIDGSMDGIACAKILNNEYFLPIIYTTAYEDSQTIIEASNTNTFGYLIKPFTKSEIEASMLIAFKRIRDFTNKLESTNTIQNHVIELGMQQTYNLTNKTFYIDNIPVDLTSMEMNLLYVFCKNLNQNITYHILQQHAWDNKEISNSTIRDTVSRLKKKIPNLNIRNVVNFGYILKK